jgi:hypothetical protein
MGRYSILIIPENHLESKHLRFSKLSIHLILFLVAILVTYMAVVTWGFLHYRQVASLANQKPISATDTREWYFSQLFSKLNQLEDSLKRTQDFAQRVESRLDVETGKLKLGIGPIKESGEFDKYLDEIARLPHPK